VWGSTAATGGDNKIRSLNGSTSTPGIFDDGDLTSRKQWRRGQRLADLFWKRWIKEFLPTLTRRTKWFQKNKNLEVGDVVLIADDNILRNTWPKGIVTKVFPGKDKLVRRAEVKTQFGVLQRPVSKIAILDVRAQDLGVESTGVNTAGENVGNH
jgi:hypothetical protein